MNELFRPPTSIEATALVFMIAVVAGVAAWSMYLSDLAGQVHQQRHEQQMRILNMKEKLISEALSTGYALNEIEPILRQIEEQNSQANNIEWTPRHIAWTIITGVATATLGAIAQYILGLSGAT